MDTFRFCSKCQQFVMIETLNGNHVCHRNSHKKLLDSFCKESKVTSTQNWNIKNNTDDYKKK